MFVLQVAEFTQVLQQLPVNCMLAAAFITYLGKEPEDVRQAAVAQWSADLGVLAHWSLTALLASETELLTWKTQGERCTCQVLPQAHLMNGSGPIHILRTVYQS